MKYWYFKFEGKFEEGSPEYGCKGVISGCMVPVNDYEEARVVFLEALKKKRIELIQIDECFDVDGNELDPDDENNMFWIEWYNDAKQMEDVVFDVLHVFDPEE